jgi:hypothetical protein
MNDLEEKYNLLFIKLEKLNNKDDITESHILEDKIYSKFIKDICNKKFTSLEDIKKIANNINKYIVKNNKKIRWYA